MKINAFTKVAEMLAKEHKIKLKEANSWKADVHTRELFYRKNDVYDLEEEHVLGLLLHEIAHIHYTTPTDLKGHPQPELAGSCLNMLEDNSIEHIIGNDYPNAADILYRTQQETLDVLIRMLPKMTNVARHEKVLLYASARFLGRGYETPLLEHEIVGQKVADYMEPKRNEILGRRETKDLMPLVDDILKIIIDVLGEPTDWEKDSMRQNNQDQSATMEKGQGSAQNAGSQNGSIKKSLIDGLKGDDASGDGWSWTGQHELGLEAIDQIINQGKRTGVAMRKILKRNQSMEYAGRFRTGKLKAKNLAKIRINHDRKPFARRIIKSNQSYAFAIAADASGSMFGGHPSAADYAFSSLYMVAEALHIAGIERVLIAFGNEALKLKDKGKSRVRWSDVNSSKINEECGGGTDISKAMRMAREELAKMTAERKVMIIVTDGESHEDSIKAEHKLAREADIECIGITIGSDKTLDRVFKDKRNVKINSTEDISIGKAFLAILKETIKEAEKHE